MNDKVERSKPIKLNTSPKKKRSKKNVIEMSKYYHDGKLNIFDDKKQIIGKIVLSVDADASIDVSTLSSIDIIVEDKKEEKEELRIPNKDFYILDTQYTVYDKITRDTEYLINQVKYLETLPQPVQRSKEWFELRKNKITASELSVVLGESKYDKPLEALLKKCGFGKPFTKNKYTEWGVKYEPIATKIYETRYKTNVIEFGLVPHRTIPFLAASPDGITPNGMMLEIKCPYTRTITGSAPHDYWTQMQLQLECCDLDECDFLECGLLEYANENEFWLDTYDDDEGNLIDETRTEKNLEKGVLLECYNRDTDETTYVYPDEISMTRKEALKWLSVKSKKYTKKKFETKKVLWKLNVYSCIRIDRNKKWFECKYPKLIDFWKDVCFYRNIGAEELLEIRNSKKRTTKSTNKYDDEEVFSENNYEFLETSDDDDGDIVKKEQSDYEFLSDSD